MAWDEIGITTALDARHAQAQAAFTNRDIEAYREIFSAEGRYEQKDGIVLDQSRLMRDVRAQFQKMDRAESRFVREKLVLDGEQVSETLIQNASFEVSLFGLVRRRWDLERRGVYTWVMEDGRWRISHVRILDEHLRGTWRMNF